MAENRPDRQSKSSSIINASYALDGAIRNLEILTEMIKEGNKPSAKEDNAVKSPDSYALSEVLDMMPERLHGRAKRIDELTDELKTLLF